MYYKNSFKNAWEQLMQKKRGKMVNKNFEITGLLSIIIISIEKNKNKLINNVYCEC